MYFQICWILNFEIRFSLSYKVNEIYKKIYLRCFYE